MVQSIATADQRQVSFRQEISGSQLPIRQRMPVYGYFGLGVIVLAEILLFAGLKLVGLFFTPVAWSGYILLVDALVFRAQSSSWLTTRRKEFLLLLPISIILWLIFEGYNQFIDNWHYVGLPENFFARVFGYAWSFATIWPAILETNEFLLVNGVFAKTRVRPFLFSRPALNLLLVVGPAFLAIPILFPSRWWAVLVWTGFVFLFDPLNFRRGLPSLITELRQGRPQLLLTLMFSGLICGFLWEFWNYWAAAKWFYTVPLWGKVKLFEMPVVGYLGFPAFALEVFVMYHFVRGFLLRKF